MTNNRMVPFTAPIFLPIHNHPLSMATAMQVIKAHEQVVGETIGIEPVQPRLFRDFPGQLKSLGAWGGDFMLAMSEHGTKEVRNYFATKGLSVVLSYDDMVWKVAR